MGYDVWLSNSRGNHYSQSHKYLDPDKDGEFWNFTFEDHAKFDLPALFDYVEHVT